MSPNYTVIVINIPNNPNPQKKLIMNVFILLYNCNLLFAFKTKTKDQAAAASLVCM